MAQVISYYTAVADGSSAMYAYELPDNTSQAKRVYNGDEIHLPLDYYERMTGSFYPTIVPGGWMLWYHVHDITPAYTIVTDPCSAPERIDLNKSAGTITITGGAGGDLNEWTGYAVSYRQRKISSTEWSAWSSETLTNSSVVSVSVASGMVRQYRARTTGTAGNAYYSPYTVCQDLLVGNTPAGTPVVHTPVSGLETFSGSVSVKIECPPEQDGDAMTLQRRLNSGSWKTVVSLSGAGGVVYDLISVGNGTHDVRYRLVDANGDTGGEDGVVFTRKAHTWKRQIVSGVIIANREISFAADITEMLDSVNQLRAFYGLSALVLPGEKGRLGDWQRQLTAMQQAVDECRAISGRAAYGFTTASGWPHAQQINQLRQAMENT